MSEARHAVPAPVDRVLDGYRLRHLPGEVVLHERVARLTGVVEPTPELVAVVNACIAGTPVGLTVLKTAPAPGQAVDRRGELFEPALIDVGVGPNANLVLTEVPGLWSWSTGTCVFPDDGAEIRSRLASFDPDAAGPVVPSLVYDTPEHPTSVQFEVTTRCNLACAYCTNRALQEREDTPLDVVRSWFDRVDFDVVDNVDFTGLGESTMHRGLAELVREVRRRGSPADIRLVTNGTAIPSRVFTPLVEAGVTSIAFSIDSLDPERFARARGGAHLKPVLRNLEALAAARDEHGWPHLAIKIKAVLDEDAYGEAERLLRYSAEVGIQMPQFATLDERAPAEAFYAAEAPGQFGGGPEGRALHADQTAALAWWAAARWRELGGAPDPRLSRPTAVERRTGYRHPGLTSPDLCRWAVDAAFVAGDGAALSCCEQMMDVPRRPYGSLAAKTMRELWGDDLLWGYRLPLALGVVPEACIGCAYAPTPEPVRLALGPA